MHTVQVFQFKNKLTGYRAYLDDIEFQCRNKKILMFQLITNFEFQSLVDHSNPL